MYIDLALIVKVFLILVALSFGSLFLSMAWGKVCRVFSNSSSAPYWEKKGKEKYRKILKEMLKGITIKEIGVFLGLILFLMIICNQLIIDILLHLIRTQ